MRQGTQRPRGSAEGRGAEWTLSGMVVRTFLVAAPILDRREQVWVGLGDSEKSRVGDTELLLGATLLNTV